MARSNDPAHREEQVKVALCRRFLAADGQIGNFGHISLFDSPSGRVFITPSINSVDGEMRPEDVIAIDFQGHMVEGTGIPPREWIIHTTIHAARPELAAVIHTHPNYATCLGIAGVPMVPVYQHGAALEREVPVYDDADLITTPEQAQVMLSCLGEARLLELRGHGSVVAGRTMEEAFALAVILEENARKQLQAHLVGQPRRLRQDELDRLLAGTINQRLFESFWRYYRLHRKLGFEFSES